MPSTSAASQIACAFVPLRALDTDLLLVPWFQDEAPSGVPGLDAATGGEIARAIASGEFAGRLFDVFLAQTTDAAWRPHRVLSIGAGRAPDCQLKWRGRLLPSAGLQPGLGASPGRPRSPRGRRSGCAGSSDCRRPHTVGIQRREPQDRGTAAGGATGMDADVGPGWRFRCATAAAVARGRLLAECSNLARDLSNEPGNALTPREFARRASALAAEGGVR
jgi:hypothetical protein